MDQPLRVLIVPDKFKGTLTAGQAASAMVRGWSSSRPQDTLQVVPMSDGGDGFGAVLGALLDARESRVATVNAAGEPVDASWWHLEKESLAIVESAEVIGLAKLPKGRFHPFQLDTRGLAPVLAAVRDAQLRTAWVGIGGSATNDAGFGLACGLGWRFLDAQGTPILDWPQLHRLDEVIPPPGNRIPGEIQVAVDVDNPLLGPRGCSRIYGPQKGLRPDQAPLAEAALGRLAEVVRARLGLDLADAPGSGAAGGLGFGLQAFAGARLVSGFELFARAARLKDAIAGADLVVTGEGCLDEQSMMGKGTGQVALLCRELGRPCLGFAGYIDPVLMDRARPGPFSGLHSLSPGLVDAAEAMARPAHWLEKLAGEVAAGWRKP